MTNQKWLVISVTIVGRMAWIHSLSFYCVIFDKLLAFVVKSGRFSSITKINLFFH